MTYIPNPFSFELLHINGEKKDIESSARIISSNYPLFHLPNFT